LSPASLLELMWLASPALPVGAFAYSEGLESAIEQHTQQAEAGGPFTAGDWLSDQLSLCLTRSELPVIKEALTAWRAADLPAVAALNAWHLATRESSELRAQTEQMGRSLLDWLRQREPNPSEPLASHLQFCASLPPSYPMVFALAAAQTRANAADCLLAYAFGWAENMVQAAVKSIPLGQTAGQRILARLTQEIPAAVDAALQLCTSERQAERQAFAPMLAILSAQHETQYSRLFRS
jgi:urease accessory protein